MTKLLILFFFFKNEETTGVQIDFINCFGKLIFFNLVILVSVRGIIEVDIIITNLRRHGHRSWNIFNQVICSKLHPTACQIHSLIAQIFGYIRRI